MSPMRPQANMRRRIVFTVQNRGLVRKLLDKIQRIFRKQPDPPEDPYAYVTAGKKPGPPSRSARAAVEEPED
jgi:hypothetical protein